MSGEVARREFDDLAAVAGTFQKPLKHRNCPLSRYTLLLRRHSAAPCWLSPSPWLRAQTRTKPLSLDNPLCRSTSTLYNNRSIVLCLPLLACLPACLACLLTAYCLFLCHINHLVRLLLAAASIACIALTVPIALAAIPSIINTAALLLFCNGLVRRGTLRLPSLLLDVL